MAVTLAAVFALTFVLAPTPASAKWHDNSDDLPMGESSTTTILLIGAGVCLVGGIVYALAKHHSNSDEWKTNTALKSDSTKADSSKSNSATKSSAIHQKVDSETQVSDTTSVTPVVPQKDSRMGLYIGVTNDKALYRSNEPAMDLSDYSVRAGVTFGF